MNLKHIMQVKLASRKTAWSHLYVESKNIKYIEAESKIVIRNREGGKWGDSGQQVQSCSDVGCVQPKDLVDGMTTIVNTMLKAGNSPRK